MDISLLNLLISPLIGYYIPIEDASMKLSVTLLLTNILYAIIHKINFDRLYNLINYFVFEKSIDIHSSSPTYDIIVEYLKIKYNDKIKTGLIGYSKDKSKLSIKAFNSNQLDDQFMHENVNYKIKIQVDTIIDSKTESSSNKITVSGYCSIDILNKYIDKVTLDSNIVRYNKIPIFSISISDDKKSKKIEWTKEITHISKTMVNTIVSHKVNMMFYEDLSKFISNEAFHHVRGLPYRRGYLLHGLPGTGKTSLIKAIANDHNLPIFIISLNEFDTNNELEKIIRDIKAHINSAQKYILLFEDVDRTHMFNGNRSISVDCFLNILDGVDEAHGRITIFTCNNLEKMKNKGTKALFRPGRIDRIIEVDMCDHDQLLRILNFHYPEHKFNVNFGIRITPAVLIQIIQHIEPINYVENLLNNIVDFTDWTLENINEEDLMDKNDNGAGIDAGAGNGIGDGDVSRERRDVIGNELDGTVIKNVVIANSNSNSKAGKQSDKPDDDLKYPEHIRGIRWKCGRFDNDLKYFAIAHKEINRMFEALLFHIRFSKKMNHKTYIDYGFKQHDSLVRRLNTYIDRRTRFVKKYGEHVVDGENVIVEIAGRLGDIKQIIRENEKQMVLGDTMWVDNTDIIDRIKLIVYGKEQDDDGKHNQQTPKIETKTA